MGAENERVDNTAPRDFSQFTYLGRAATFFSLTDANSLDLGASYAYTPEVKIDERERAPSRRSSISPIAIRRSARPAIADSCGAARSSTTRRIAPSEASPRNRPTCRSTSDGATASASTATSRHSHAALLPGLPLRVRPGHRSSGRRHQGVLAVSHHLGIRVPTVPSAVHAGRRPWHGQPGRSVLPAVDGRPRQPRPQLP